MTIQYCEWKVPFAHFANHLFYCFIVVAKMILHVNIQTNKSLLITLLRLFFYKIKMWKKSAFIIY